MEVDILILIIGVTAMAIMLAYTIYLDNKEFDND